MHQLATGQRPRPGRRRRIALVFLPPVVAGLLVVANLLAVELGRLTGDLGEFTFFTNAIGLLTLTAVTVGVVIAWHQPGQPIAWLLVVGGVLLMWMFVCWPVAVVLGSRTGPGDWPIDGVFAWMAMVFQLPSMFLLFPAVGLVFPDGRLPGPRWRPAVAAVVGLLVLASVLMAIAPWEPIPDVAQNPFAVPGVPVEVGLLGSALSTIALLAGLGLAVAAVAVRLRGSRGVERAQLKWLVAAVAVNAITLPVSFATDIGPDELIDLGSVLVGCAIPIAVGVAVLRYRLYDIDRVIGRTVAWAIITSVLVATFALAVIALQAVLDGVTQGETLAVAASTLVAFALFQPVRRRVQSVVDRRFDRARVDAQRTMDAFAERVRDEVDLASILGTLLVTTDDAVRPSASGTWLRRPTGRT